MPTPTPGPLSSEAVRFLPWSVPETPPQPAAQGSVSFRPPTSDRRNLQKDGGQVAKRVSSPSSRGLTRDDI